MVLPELFAHETLTKALRLTVFAVGETLETRTGTPSTSAGRSSCLLRNEIDRQEGPVRTRRFAASPDRCDSGIGRFLGNVR